MNRFLRTAYSATLVYLFLALIAALITGVGMPFSSYLCVYFGLLSALLPYAAPKASNRGALLTVLGVGLALMGFLPIWLLGCTIVHYIAHGLGMLAAALFFHTLKHRTTHNDFAAKFRFSVVLLLALIAYLYLSLLIGFAAEDILSVRKEYVSEAIDHVVPIAIMLLVTGVLLLRGLRGLEGTVDEKAFNRRQLRDLLIYASIVSVVFLVNPFPYLIRVLNWLMDDVVRPAARGLKWALGRLLDLLANKSPKFDAPTPEATPDPSEYYLPPPESTLFSNPDQYKVDETGETSLYRTILYIFVTAVAVILLVILLLEIRKMIRRIRDRNGARGRGYPHEILESLDDGDTVKEKKALKKRSAVPRMRIRYLYSEFLRHLRRVPIHIEAADTCGKINERAKKVMRGSDEDLSEFRELYEQARYCEDRTPTERDAARMKTLLDRLKKGRK